MVSEMETEHFLCSFAPDALEPARVEPLFMVLEMVLVVSEMFEPGCSPRQHWVCGVPSLY